MMSICFELANAPLLHQKPARSFRPCCARPGLENRTSSKREQKSPLCSAQTSNACLTKRGSPVLTACLSTQAHTADPQTTTASSEAEWSTFCDNVSGEWEGATATFTADGQPQELPSQYVPKEFRDWNVTLYDWQSQCSMQPQATGIKCLLKRLMPTVGCEADAQTFHEEARHLLESTDEATQHAIFSNGSYTTVSSLDLSDQTKLRLEHCLVTAEKKRIRLVQHVTAAGPSDPWQLSNVEVHHEYYDGPYNGGASLSGCGGGMSNFAELDKFAASQLQHDWTASSGSSYSVLEDGTIQPQHLPPRMSSCSQEGITCLPLNAYSIVQSKNHGELLVEAGVLQKNGTLLVAQQTFDNGQCKAMSLGTESVQSYDA
ncbi:TPA: hypothetical protein ACH3X3_009083 [Trebouxia sp. C0006]